MATQVPYKKGRPMAAVAEYLDFEESHPIDIVEHIASNQSWEFDRIHEDQIAMSVAGLWRNYTITLAWSESDETLRMICTFDMEPPEHRIPHLCQALNAVNDNCWAGAFTYWEEQNLMIYRYGLILSGGQMASPDQIDTMISCAVAASEKYYPALQLVTWGERSVSDAMQVAIAEAYGRA